MKIKLYFFLVLIAAALLLSSGNTAAFAQESSGDVLAIAPEGVTVTTFVYPYGETPPVLSQSEPPAVPWTDIAVHGTMWRPEKQVQFSVFNPYGWGTAAKVKAASYQWVHLSIPYITFMEDIAQKIRYVEFCAQSSAGIRTKPIALHLWAGATRFYAGAVAWPATNTLNCSGTFFTPGIWKEDLGVSVQLKYANIADTITLYNAWASFER
jgi:hypothetical protein